MKFATGHAFNLDELFLNFDISKLKLTCDLCNKINHNPHKHMLVNKIFRESVKIILNDIIDNNNTFELPTDSIRSEIHMKKFDYDDFSRLRRIGKWRDVDYLSSFFTGYQLFLFMYNREGKPVREKPIYVDPKLKDKITENTNKGMQYC